MKGKPARKPAPGYPSILELAMKAGKWSLVAGGSALIIGSSACGPLQTMGVIATDEYEEDSGRDATQDVPVIDTGLFVDPGTEVTDSVEVDPGMPLPGEPIPDIFPPDDAADVQE